MYWERQQGSNTCRMHALNAFFQGPVYTWSSFLQMCNRFDARSNVALGTSTTWTSAHDKTLFQFAISEKGSKAVTIPLAMYASRNNSTDADAKTQYSLQHALRHAMGAFVYNSEHVWYLLKTDRGWFKIDSLGGIRAESLQNVWRDGLGIEVVYKDHDTKVCKVISAVPATSASAMPSSSVSEPLRFGVPHVDRANIPKCLPYSPFRRHLILGRPKRI